MKIVRWILIACGVLFVLAVAAVFLAVAGPRPKPVEGTDCPPWLPSTASNIFYRSQHGFGWWKAAEFTISENDLNAFVTERGWNLREERDYVLTVQLLKPASREATDSDFLVIPKALAFEHRQSNNGGVTLVYDPSTSRAYYMEAHR